MIRYFFLEVAVVRAMWASTVSYFFCSRVAIHVVVLLHYFLHTAPIGSDEVSGNLLRRVDLVVSRCVALQAPHAFRAIAYMNMTYNGIDSVFLRWVSELICCRMHSIFVVFVILFVERLVWGMFLEAVCVFADGPSVACSADTKFHLIFLLRWRLVCLMTLQNFWSTKAMEYQFLARLCRQSLCSRGWKWRSIDADIQ